MDFIETFRKYYKYNILIMKWQRSHSTTTFLGNGHILLRINGNFGIFLIPIAVTCDEGYVKSVDRIAK